MGRVRIQGNATLLGSRDTLREAFRLGLICDGEGWMLMIQDRNLILHTYNRATAEVIAGNIRDRYHLCFQQLRQQLNERLQQEQNGCP